MFWYMKHSKTLNGCQKSKEQQKKLKASKVSISSPDLKYPCMPKKTPPPKKKLKKYGATVPLVWLEDILNFQRCPIK